MKESKFIHQTGHKPPTVKRQARSKFASDVSYKKDIKTDLEALQIFC